MPKYSIISADAHILEPPDIWKNWLPERYQDRAPQLVKDSEGGDAWLFAGGDRARSHRADGHAGHAVGPVPVEGRHLRRGARRLLQRRGPTRRHDADGVDAEVLFPPQRTIGHFLGADDDDFVRAGVEAYNNFLFEEFCAPDRTRLIGAAQIPSTGIDDAVDFLRKAKARGFKTVVISCWPSGGEAISDDDDPFWAAAADEGVPGLHPHQHDRPRPACALARPRPRPAARQLYGEGRAAPGPRPRPACRACSRSCRRRSAS